MKKKVLGLALIALSLAGFSAAAQQNADTKAQGKELRKELKGQRHGERKHINPFEGLNLTEAQQGSLQQLDNKRKEARKAQAQAGKESRQKMKTEMRGQRKAARKAYLDEVKAILTPEQYVNFLENNYLNAAGRKGHKSAMHSAKGDKKKGQRDGRRGDKQGKRQNDGGKQGKKNS